MVTPMVEPVGQVAPQALPDKWRVIPDKGIVRELASLAPWPTRWEEYLSAQGQEVKNRTQSRATAVQILKKPGDNSSLPSLEASFRPLLGG